MSFGFLVFTSVFVAFGQFKCIFYISSFYSLSFLDISASAVITNLDATATILESQPIGTFVYQVSQTDVNTGDTPTFSATFPTAGCESMYDINPTSKSAILCYYCNVIHSLVCQSILQAAVASHYHNYEGNSHETCTNVLIIVVVMVITYSVVHYYHTTFSFPFLMKPRVYIGASVSLCLSTSDGTVTTLIELDFETDVQCTMIVTVFDGLATSNPGTLTIDVSDVDDPPVMSNTGYVINTEEVAVSKNL